MTWRPHHPAPGRGSYHLCVNYFGRLATWPRNILSGKTKDGDDFGKPKSKSNWLLPQVSLSHIKTGLCSSFFPYSIPSLIKAEIS